MPQAQPPSRIDEVAERAAKRYLSLFAEHLRSAEGKRFYAADPVMFGLLNRNLGLLRAMPALVKEKNIHALAPLLRVQLDGLLRLYAFKLVEKMDVLALHVMSGKRLSSFKDRAGEQLRDAYLVKSLKEELPWIEPVYESLSGWVHFSESHIFSALSPGKSENSFVVAIGDLEKIPDALFAEATEAIDTIHAATAELLEGYFAVRGGRA